MKLTVLKPAAMKDGCYEVIATRTIRISNGKPCLEVAVVPHPEPTNDSEQRVLSTQEFLAKHRAPENAKVKLFLLHP